MPTTYTRPELKRKTKDELIDLLIGKSTSNDKTWFSAVSPDEDWYDAVYDIANTVEAFLDNNENVIKEHLNYGYTDYLEVYQFTKIGDVIPQEAFVFTPVS